MITMVQKDYMTTKWLHDYKMATWVQNDYLTTKWLPDYKMTNWLQNCLPYYKIPTYLQNECMTTWLWNIYILPDYKKIHDYKMTTWLQMNTWLLNDYLPKKWTPDYKITR